VVGVGDFSECGWFQQVHAGVYAGHLLLALGVALDRWRYKWCLMLSQVCGELEYMCVCVCECVYVCARVYAYTHIQYMEYLM